MEGQSRWNQLYVFTDVSAEKREQQAELYRPRTEEYLNENIHAKCINIYKSERDAAPLRKMRCENLQRAGQSRYNVVKEMIISEGII